MRRIGIIETEADARKFGDYLLAHDFENRVDDFDEHWAVWIEEEDQIEAASQELEAFLKEPDNSKYNAAGEKAHRIRKKVKTDEKRWRGKHKDLRTSFRKLSVMPPRVTMTLIIISAIVGVITRLGHDPNNPLTGFLSIATYSYDGYSIRWPGLSEIAGWQVWRLFTPMFLHFGILHIIFNMYWLHYLGGLVEGRKGHWFYFGLILCIAGISNFAQYFSSGPNFGGMSGVNFGLLGYVWVKMKFQPEDRIYIDPANITMMMIWLVICFSGFVGPIANTAHVGGLVVGALWGYFPTAILHWRRSRFRRR